MNIVAKPTAPQVPVFTILVKATGKKVDGLSIEDVHTSESTECSVVFLTPANKKWKIRLSEFSFVFPAPKLAAA